MYTDKTSKMTLFKTMSCLSEAIHEKGKSKLKFSYGLKNLVWRGCSEEKGGVFG